jgi:hypothetical protein
LAPPSRDFIPTYWNSSHPVANLQFSRVRCPHTFPSLPSSIPKRHHYQHHNLRITPTHNHHSHTGLDKQSFLVFRANAIAGIKALLGSSSVRFCSVVQCKVSDFSAQITLPNGFVPRRVADLAQDSEWPTAVPIDTQQWRGRM